MRFTNYLKNLFKKKTQKTQLELLIEDADKKWKESGRQYFVMPIGNDKYMLCHGKTFQNDYNKAAKKLGTKHMSFIDMINICAYKTPNGTTGKR